MRLPQSQEQHNTHLDTTSSTAPRTRPAHAGPGWLTFFLGHVRLDAGGYAVKLLIAAVADLRAHVAHLGGAVNLVQNQPGVVAAASQVQGM